MQGLGEKKKNSFETRGSAPNRTARELQLFLSFWPPDVWSTSLSVFVFLGLTGLSSPVFCLQWASDTRMKQADTLLSVKVPSIVERNDSTIRIIHLMSTFPSMLFVIVFLQFVWPSTKAGCRILASTTHFQTDLVPVFFFFLVFVIVVPLPHASPRFSSTCTFLLVFWVFSLLFCLINLCAIC